MNENIGATTRENGANRAPGPDEKRSPTEQVIERLARLCNLKMKLYADAVVTTERAEAGRFLSLFVTEPGREDWELIIGERTDRRLVAARPVNTPSYLGIDIGPEDVRLFGERFPRLSATAGGDSDSDLIVGVCDMLEVATAYPGPPQTERILPDWIVRRRSSPPYDRDDGR